MSHGRCVTCGAPGKARERRPDGDTICENGHKHSSAAFDRHEQSYKNNAAFGLTRLDAQYPSFVSLTALATGEGFQLDVRSDPLLRGRVWVEGPRAAISMTIAELDQLRRHLNKILPPVGSAS